ncbi:ExbD/TolR family protein [soil metagenome]|nr:biopolymer transporter ExbD [Acidobacteriota bacterium]
MPSIQKSDNGGGGRGRRRGPRVASSLSEINVVPLVDVMLVLLIIFMVTAPMMQQGMEVNLPESRRSTAVQAQPLYVTIPMDFGRSQRVQIDKDFVPIEFLSERMRQATLTRDDKSVFVRADGQATMQDFITVSEALRAAGIDRIGIMTQPLAAR